MRLSRAFFQTRTGAHLLASPEKDVEASTAFIVGGMYGNPFALSAILERASEEEASGGRGGKPLMVFNGDFNFFNCTPRLHALHRQCAMPPTS